MDTPTNKIALLNSMEEGRREWEAVFARLDEKAMLEAGVEGAWSVKEILAHITGFEEYAGPLLTDLYQPEMRAQEKLDDFYQQQLDQHGAMHSGLPTSLDALDGDQTNLLFVFARQSHSVGQVREAERIAYQRLLDGTRALTETDLTDPSKGGGRTLLEILPNQSFAHYRMHMPAIRLWLEERKRRLERSPKG